MKVPTALEGCQVDRVAFDYHVRLYFSALDPDEGYRVDAELVIEASFIIRDELGEWHELDPGSGSVLAPALDLFRKSVAAVEVKENGGLHLVFNDAMEIFISPDPRSRSWRLSGEGVDGITVGPGGATFTR